MVSAMRCGLLLSLTAVASGCAGVRPPCDDKTVADLTTLSATTAAALEGCDDFMAYQSAKHMNGQAKYDIRSESNMMRACKCLHEALADDATPDVKADCKARIDASLTYEKEKCKAAP